MKKLVLLVVFTLVASLCASSIVVAESSHLSAHEMGKKEVKAAKITVNVTDDEDRPVQGATVILWNHTATPTEQVGVSYSDQDGRAYFSVPEYKGMERELTQHLSVTASYPGATTAIVNWSIDRKALAGDGKIVEIDAQSLGNTLVSAKITKEKLAICDTITAEGIAPYSMITVQLVNWDYTSGVNKSTVVGHQHQVGNLESKFWYKQKVSNRFETKVKRSWKPSWEISGYITRTNATSTDLTWTLSAVSDDAGYKYRNCITQYDYRFEEYVELTYMDRGDGFWEWIETDRWLTAFAHALNPYASPAGAILTLSPPTNTTWLTGNPIAPGGKVEHAKTGNETIGGAVTLPVPWIGGTVTIGLDHSTSQTVGWGYENKSSTKTYLQGLHQGQVYYKLRP